MVRFMVMGRVKVMGRVRVRVLEGAVVPTVIIRVTHIVFIAGGRRELDESSRVWPTFRALGGTVEASQLMLGSERRRPESTIICGSGKEYRMHPENVREVGRKPCRRPWRRPYMYNSRIQGFKNSRPWRRPLGYMYIGVFK